MTKRGATLFLAAVSLSNDHLTMHAVFANPAFHKKACVVQTSVKFPPYHQLSLRHCEAA